MIKRVLCLANSKKMSGRCIAGREVTAVNTVGHWIRPVSSRENEAVSESERQYAGGVEPRVLDLIDIPLIGHHPHACQTENWRLDPSSHWVRVGSVGWSYLQPFVEAPTTLWSNDSSTYNGYHDEVARLVADALPNSLSLIKVPALQLRIFTPGAAFGNNKKRVQARFEYNATPYWLFVTDPLLENEYISMGDGIYDLGESCLCISLSEPFQKADGDEYRYKLVASITQRALVQP